MKVQKKMVVRFWLVTLACWGLVACVTPPEKPSTLSVDDYKHLSCAELADIVQDSYKALQTG